MIDKDKIYKHNINICNVSKCNNISRNFRDKNIYDKNVNQRNNLYNCKTEKHIIIQQMIDIIHISKYHLIDIGLRYDSNECIETFGRTRMKNIMETRLRFIKIRNDINQSDLVYASSKFVTKIFDNNRQETDLNENKINGDTKYPEYSSGIRFYYHPYYENKKEKSEKLPGTNVFDDGNTNI
eukprot:61874_1